MSQSYTYRLSVVLTEAELKALSSVLEHTFTSPEPAALAAVLGTSHHNQVKAAKRMHEKVTNAVECARRLVNKTS